MTARVFFSFDHEIDWARAELLRQVLLAQGGEEPAGMTERAAWDPLEPTEAQNAEVRTALQPSSALVLLIGSETAMLHSIQSELLEGWRQAKPMVGVRVHNIPDPHTGVPAPIGRNPLDFILFEDDDGSRTPFSAHVPVFDWVEDDGPRNLHRWVERSARPLPR